MTRLNKKPLVTVLMTAYNAQDFINEAVNSVLRQTYKNLEIIIVDDGSTDLTYKICKQYSRLDKRVKVFQMKRNSGPSLASNLGLKKAHGKFIARMDADDIAFPDRIEKQLNFMLENPEVVIAGGQCTLINEAGQVIGEKRYPLNHEEIYNSLFGMNPIQHPACMFRTDLLPKSGIIYHNHSLLAHDLELVFELSKYGKLANLEDVILYYRYRPNSLSLRDPKATFKHTVDVRHKALRQYKYTPTFKGWLTHYIQMIIVLTLPNKAVYALFKFLRIKKSLNQKFGFSPAKQSFTKLAIRALNILL